MRTATLFVIAAAMLVGPGVAAAQKYPTRPVRVIVPFPPGGNVETLGRVLYKYAEQELGQPIVIDSRGGANSILGSDLVAKSSPDGYTFLHTSFGFAVNPAIVKKLPFDVEKDFAPVTSVALGTGYLMVIHPSVPAKSVKELVGLAKRRPGELHFASAGSGSGTHLAFELFKSMARIKVVHVPYKGGSAALIDVIGGHVQLMMSNTINSRPHVMARKLNALAMSTPKRSPLYPDVPTVAESGLPGYQADTWYGVMAPAKTPAGIVERLNREIVAILKTNPEFKARLAAEGADVLGGTPEEFAALLRAEIAKWANVTAGLKLD